uniref:Sulfatase N-terminal domain-containing protein n=1 Tax=Alexandrium monilatum TaxID=311494 RepID=A0A7S4SZ52_9DINO
MVAPAPASASALLLQLLLLPPSALAAAEAPKPHVLLLLADDFGWANWGFHNDGYGPHGKQLQAEIFTPNLDQLAREGVVLDRHYAFRICSPSRSSLMSGRLPMHVNWKNTGITSLNPKDPVSGSAGIPRNMTGMAAKLKEAGYRTHMVGKWDAGAATPEHTPVGRGFETFVGYHQHANDYWQEGIGFSCTGEIDVCMDKFVDFHVYNATFTGGVTPEIAREFGCHKDTAYNQSATVALAPQVTPTGCVNASYCLPESCYEEAMLRQRALQVIKGHDASTPLFLFYTSHLLHTPLQVPESYLKRVDQRVAEQGGQPVDSANRRLYAAMTLFLDETAGELVRAMKAKGLWENTLVIFTSDNGGPIYEPGSANNYPLKGGKYSDWEGGVRTNAFVSGGFIPPERRGARHTGVVSIADWYGLVSELAGVDQEDKAAAEANAWLAKQGLPLLKPVDSVPQWKHIVQGTNGRPNTLYVSDKAVLRYPYKLVAGDQVYSMFTGQLYPNCSTIEGIATKGPAVPLLDDVHLFGELLDLGLPREKVDAVMDTEHCGQGKLFNVKEDPTEQNDLSADPQYADVLQELRSDLAEFNQGLFDPDRGVPTMDACWIAMRVGGFYGPYVDAEKFYSPVQLSPRQIENNRIAKEDLTYVEKVLLPNRTKQIEWLEGKVGDLTQLLRGDVFDKCLKPPPPASTGETITMV